MSCSVQFKTLTTFENDMLLLIHTEYVKVSKLSFLFSFLTNMNLFCQRNAWLQLADCHMQNFTTRFLAQHKCIDVLAIRWLVACSKERRLFGPESTTTTATENVHNFYLFYIFKSLTSLSRQ